MFDKVFVILAKKQKHQHAMYGINHTETLIVSLPQLKFAHTKHSTDIYE